MNQTFDPIPVQLRLLGDLRLSVGETTVEPPAQAQRLLGYLGLHRGVPRTHVAGLLWPDVTEAHALGSLRTTLWRLHRCHDGLVVPGATSVMLHPTVRVDVERLITAARRVLASQAAPEDEQVLIGAGSDDLLPGWYDDWVMTERERLRQLRLHALDRLAESLIARERYAEAIEAGLVAVGQEPLRESAHRLLVRAHVAEGNNSEALRTFTRFRTTVGRELGVAPSPQMLELVNTLVR